MSADVHEAADLLRRHATHFVERDWNYTGDLGDLSAIRYDWPDERLLGRIKSAFWWLFDRNSAWGAGWAPNRFVMARYALKRDANLPDGVLDGGNIITFWAETGEYLQLVQPTVGALVADLLDAHPDLPEVRAVADEIERLAP